jgi:hypothetical protein
MYQRIPGGKYKHTHVKINCTRANIRSMRLKLKGRSVVNLLQFFIVFFGHFLYKFHNKKLKISKVILL